MTTQDFAKWASKASRLASRAGERWILEAVFSFLRARVLADWRVPVALFQPQSPPKGAMPLVSNDAGGRHWSSRRVEDCVVDCHLPVRRLDTAPRWECQVTFWHQHCKAVLSLGQFSDKESCSIQILLLGCWEVGGLGIGADPSG